MEKLIADDPQLQRYIEEIEQNQRIKQITDKLTDQCWTLCVKSPNVAKFDHGTESCLVNCVNRFIDSNQIIMTAFAQKGQQQMSSFSSSSSTFSDAEMLMDDKSFSRIDGPAKTSEPEKKSGWKLW